MNENRLILENDGDDTSEYIDINGQLIAVVHDDGWLIITTDLNSYHIKTKSDFSVGERIESSTHILTSIKADNPSK